MSTLHQVNKVVVPRLAITTVRNHLQHMGRHGLEGFALWAGTRNGDSFTVTHPVIPRQRGIRTDSGVCVVLESGELHRLNVWLYQNSLSLVAQIHSHPAEAYHSETDDSLPVATAVGSFSLVVPYFAMRPFSIAGCAVYRLSTSAEWVEVPTPDAESIFTVTE